MSTPAGPFSLPPLPWADNALDPVISAKTIGLHYGKHHRAYVNNLNGLVAGTKHADMSLEDVMRDSAAGGPLQKVFNNSAQIWNHTFFWNCLKKGGGGKPTGELAALIDRDLGGYDKFREQFAATCVNTFGSGWGWLVAKGGRLEFASTSNAMTPLVQGSTPLLTIDVWEHAYYVDYENRRPDFVNAVIDKLLNWDFAAKQLASAKK